MYIDIDPDGSNIDSAESTTEEMRTIRQQLSRINLLKIWADRVRTREHSDTARKKKWHRFLYIDIDPDGFNVDLTRHGGKKIYDVESGRQAGRQKQ